MILKDICGLELQLQLSRCVSRGSTRGTCAFWMGAMPRSEAFFCDRGCSGFVKINDIRQKETPAIMWHVRHIVVGSLTDVERRH